MIDDGPAVHYSAVTPGTPVYSSDGVVVGEVHQIVDNYREHIFDGVVIKDKDGEFRFADAPEVARTAERGVTLELDAAAAAQLPPPEEGEPSFQANVSAGKLRRFFGGGWKRR